MSEIEVRGLAEEPAVAAATAGLCAAWLRRRLSWPIAATLPIHRKCLG